MIVATSNPAVAILKPVSGQVPIVFAMVADPVGSGFIENLAKPGGKLTGFTNFEPSMGGKWLEVLREAAPATRHVLVLMHPETSAHREFWQAIEEMARPLQVETMAAGVHNATEIERAFAEFASTGNGGGVIALPRAFGRRDCPNDSALGRGDAVIELDAICCDARVWKWAEPEVQPSS